MSDQPLNSATFLKLETEIKEAAETALRPKTAVSVIGLSHQLAKVSITTSDPMSRSKRLKDNEQRVEREDNVASGVVKTTAKIVDPSDIASYKEPLTRLRTYFNKNTLAIGEGKQPFRTYPIKNLKKFKAEIDVMIQEARDGINEFKREYSCSAEWLRKQEQRMGNRFDINDYPSVNDVIEKLKVSDLNIDAFGDIAKSAGLYLDGEMLQQLSDSQTRMEERVREYATKDLYDKILEPLQNIVKRCSKKKGEAGSTFHDTMITNMKDVLKALPTLNFEGDETLEEVRQHLEDMLSDITPNQLREFGEVDREEFANKAKQGVDKLNGYKGSSV